MNDPKEVKTYEKVLLLAHILGQKRTGNIEFAEQLRIDLIEYLKSNNIEYIWVDESLK